MKSYGARFLGKGLAEFAVWAPLLKKLSLRMISAPGRLIPLAKDRRGFFSATVTGVKPGNLYVYRFDDGCERPDPLSHFQPEGVFGPSSLVDHGSFPWRDGDWQGIPLEDMIIYELHVGTFTGEGTFDGVVKKLPYLRDLGVTAIELMPVSQFSGTRNWGYDGTYPFAVQNSYGGPDGLKRLVDGCHARGLAVLLDVVYNHLGPEGAFLGEFMPCYAEHYRTSWGRAINFDGAYSDGIRELFIQNALHWLGSYHIDGLRLDAIHGIFDLSAKPFLAELTERVAEFSRSHGRRRYVFAESDLNDTRVVRPPSQGGYGLDGQWNDDFHHSLHGLLTGERHGYYGDFGRVGQLAKAVREGFVYSWTYSKFRKRRHGSSSAGVPATSFVVFSQNHDQTGNRARGERLASLAPFEALKAAAGLTLLSVDIPLLFMGEETAEEAPFPYFADFRDPGLVRAVRDGRARLFAACGEEGQPLDPFDENVFASARLSWPARLSGRSRTMLDFYKALIRARRRLRAHGLAGPGRPAVRFDERTRTLSAIQARESQGVLLVVNLRGGPSVHRPKGLAGCWDKVLDSSETRWLGPGSNLPATIGRGAELRLGPFGLGLYRRRP